MVLFTFANIVTAVAAACLYKVVELKTLKTYLKNNIRDINVN